LTLKEPGTDLETHCNYSSFSPPQKLHAANLEDGNPLTKAIPYLGRNAVAVTLKILHGLEDESISFGTYDEYRKQACHSILTCSGFVENLTRAAGPSQQEGDLRLCALLLSLAAGHDCDSVVSKPQIKDLAKLLVADARCDMSETLAALFDIPLDGLEDEHSPAVDRDVQEILRNAPGSIQAAKAVMKPPGTRQHGNDFKDFRQIAIVPPAEELQSEESAWLPPPGQHGYGADGHHRNQITAHLDRLFRLMREDMVEPIRSELRDELKLPDQQRKRLLTDPRLVGVDDGRGLELTFAFRPTIGLSQRLLRMKTSRERKEFLEDGPGRRVLASDTIVVFYNHRASRQGTDLDIVAVGVVSGRQDILGSRLLEKKQDASGRDSAGTPGPDKHARAHHEPISLYANIHFPQLKDLPARLKAALGGLPHARYGTEVAKFAFCASASYFSYEPVLSGLQHMSTVPLAYHLLPGCPDTTPDAHPREGVHSRLPVHMQMRVADLDAEVMRKVALDPGQSDALKLLTSEKVVLVQGPPGTGKTYVGVQMVQAMLKAAAGKGHRLKILCMCYTNHALDSFLLSLLEDGVARNAIVRLGGGPRVSEQLQDRTLRELPDAKFNKDQSRRYAMLKSQMEAAGERSQAAYKQLKFATWGSTPGVQQWEDISSFLDDAYAVEFQELQLPDAKLGPDGGGFQTVGKGGKNMSPQALWTAWCKGEKPPPYAPDRVLEDYRRGEDSIWRLSKGERRALKEKWNAEATSELVREYVGSLLVKQELHRNLQQLRDESRSAAIHGNDIKLVGCTTVGAAKRMDILSALRPDVLLLEEAGEVFEAQVLVAAMSCHQIIMIGDHQQLRPKAEHFELRKEADKGHDIDVSLFERLVLQTARPLRLATLQIQHRMRPEISSFPRALMYPNLRDAEGTKGRENVPGVGIKERGRATVAANVVFVTHTHKERSDEEAAALGSNSKINDHEADMVVAIAKYLLEQEGVASSDIGKPEGGDVGAA
jgi:hypothetical protein